MLLSLHAKIKTYYYEEMSLVLLNDGTFILYTPYDAVKFSKNLISKEIISLSFKDIKKNEIITSVKQLKNGTILCCKKDLYIYNIKSKKINSKNLKMPNKNEKIFNIIELQNENIIGISNKSILKIRIGKEPYVNNEITQLFKIPEQWLENIDNNKIFNKNLDIYELTNNNLLINSHLFYISRRCPTSNLFNKYENLVFILNLDNYKINHIISKNYDKTSIAIFKKFICIGYDECIYLYDINNFKLHKKIVEKSIINTFIKYNENMILAVNNNSDLILYDFTNLKNIKYKIYENNIFGSYSLRVIMCKLNERKFIIYHNGNIYIFEFIGNFVKKAWKKIKQ